MKMVRLQKFILVLYLLTDGHSCEALMCNKCRETETCDTFEDQTCIRFNPPLASDSDTTENKQDADTKTENEGGDGGRRRRKREADTDGCMFAHSGVGEILSGCTDGPSHDCIHSALAGFRPDPCIKLNSSQLEDYNKCIVEKEKECPGVPLCSKQESLAFCFCNRDMCNDRLFLKKVSDAHDDGEWIRSDFKLILALLGFALFYNIP